MARTLEELKQQYSSGKNAPQNARNQGRHMRMKGKPKNAAPTIKRMLGYVSEYKLRLVIVFLCMILSTVASLLGGYMIAPVIDRILLAINPDAEVKLSGIQRFADGIVTKLMDIMSLGAFSEVIRYIISAIIIALTLYLVVVITTYLQSRLMLSVSQGAIERLRNDLFTKLQKLPVRYFDSKPTGEIMSRFTNDIDNIDVMINTSLTSVLSGMITLIGTFTFMVTTNWILTLVTVFFIPIFFKGGGWIAKHSSKYYSGQQAALGAVNGYIEETVSGQKVVKVFNHEKTCVEEFGLLNNDMRDKQLMAQFWGGVMGPIMGNTSQICYSVTVGIGGIMMCLTGFTPGALTVFANYSKQFSMPINQLGAQMSTVFAALAGAERVFAVMDEKPENYYGKAEKSIEKITGHVILDDVTFGYTPDKTVLKNISLYAKPGQKIAFVGLIFQQVVLY